jgi:predicted flap endonuclease-1-like 5' DNA nuclease/Zn finger protein HypA/HybF involved in hydrogenase expression
MDRRGARRAATFIFTLTLLTLLASIYVALVYHGDFDQGAEWIVNLNFGEWIAIFAVALAVLFLILLILFVASNQSMREAQNPELQVECAQCHKAYVIEDTGQRPLYHVCPHCTYTNVLGEGQQAPIAEPIVAPETTMPATSAQVEETEEQVIEREEGGVMRKFLVLRCGACSTQFETPYSAERPLITACGNCGRKGILRARGGAAGTSQAGRPVIDIEGIGPEYSKRLAEQGINTVTDLRGADPTILGVGIDVPADTIREWQGMAELMDIKGIGPQFSELLVKSGIASVKELSEADPDELLAKIDATNASRTVRIQGAGVGKKTVKNWINAAKKAA